jgi:hypothetical protein
MGLRAAWRELTVEHRRWLFLNAIVITALVNAALSALIAWGSAASEDEIPLLAAPFVEGPSTIVDSVGTFFILPFLTTLLITTTTWHELREGRLAQVHSEFSQRFRSLPKRRLRRGAFFGLLCVILFSPAAVILLLAFDYGDIGVGEFVVFKAIFGIVLGLVVTPVIAVAALHDPPEVYGQPAAAAEPARQT